MRLSNLVTVLGLNQSQPGGQPAVGERATSLEAGDESHGGGLEVSVQKFDSCHADEVYKWDDAEEVA